MQKIKSIVLTFLLAFIIFSLFSFNSQSNASSSDLFLNNLNFDAIVNSDGSMDVTETWDIDIEDTNTLFKTFKTDKSKYSGIENVKVSQVEKNGTVTELKEINELMYHVTKNCYYGLKNKEGNFEIAWGVGLDSGSARRTYKISYTVKDTIKNCDNFSELYWQFVGKDFEINAENITGKITLPSNARDKRNIKVWGHIESLNGEIYATSPNTVEFEIDKFRHGRFVEIRVAIPEEIHIYSNRVDHELSIQDIINEETKWADAANRRRERSIVGATLIYILAILFVIGLCVLFIYRIIKNISIYKKLPEKFKKSQDIKYYRDLPDENSTPGEAYRMLKSKLTEFYSTEIGNIFAATLLDLSLKGLIEFENDNSEKSNIKIIMKNVDNSAIADNLDELAIHRFLQDATKGKTITVKDLEKYIKNHETKVINLKKKIDAETEHRIYNKNYANKNEKKIRENHTGYMAGYIVLLVFTLVSMLLFPIIMDDEAPVLGSMGDVYGGIFVMSGFLLSIIAIINIIIKNKTANKVNVFTQIGIDKANEWNGLKKFMEEFSLLDKREVPEIVIWEKYLVYATAFGIADKVIKQLKIVYPNIEDINNFHTGVYMGLMMNSSFSTSFSHSISSAMSSAYSSGTGGGGGFSGGGGRRPEEVGGGGGR
ncbi:MAG: DUF2207 domain-containing protein [Clostridia bacterium]|nr:DUF2207 domain-containing protein [Clostridia bacterium]